MKLNRGITVMAAATATAIAMAAGSAVAAGDDPGVGDPVPMEPPSPPVEPAAPAAMPGTTPVGMPIYPPDTGERPEPTGRWMPGSRIGLAILAGGGVTDFTGGGTRANTGTGGFWDFRFAVATRYWIGFEGSYIGGANSIQGLGLSGDSTLLRNGLEGALRLQAPLHAGGALLEPYVLGGAGWNGYRVSNVSTYTASVTSSRDNTLSVPLGVGFAVGYKGFMGDLRYTFRPTYQQTILANQSGTGLSNWDAGAMIGYEF